MVTKTDLKRLLSKGLTGREAAQLVLQDSWEVDHKRLGFLSMADIQRIKGGLRTQADIQEYNRLIHVYQLVDYTLKDARIMGLEAIQALLLSYQELRVYWEEDRLRRAYLMGLPAIVTQKQYDELRAKQREKLLQEIKSLGDILAELAELRVPEPVEEEWDESGRDILDFLAQARPEMLKLLSQIAGDIIQPIREGKLRPVQLQPEQLKELDLLEKRMDEVRARHQGEEVWQDEELMTLSRQKEKLLADFYRAGSSQLQGADIARLASSLEAWLAGSLSQEEAEKLLETTYISEEQLYRAGLPESIEWIESYKPDLDDESMARPAGKVQSSKVAILQDPGPSDLDERGYYKEPGYLDDLSGYASRQNERKDFSIPDFLEAMHNLASERIKGFLAIQAAVEAVSQTVGVQFTEDLEKQYQELQANVGMYNYLVAWEPVPAYLGMPKLAELKIGRLKPTARSLRYYRERMAIALGDDWLKEAFKTLNFKPSEAGSLAEIMARELREAKQKLGLAEDEEESDGQEA